DRAGLAQANRPRRQGIRPGGAVWFYRRRSSPQEQVMLIIQVYITVKPDCVEDFKQATIENARASRKEPGIARFDLLQQSDDPTKFVLVEVYRSVAAPAAHKETKHYAAWRERAEPLMAAPRTRQQYTNVSPGDEGW